MNYQTIELKRLIGRQYTDWHGETWRLSRVDNDGFTRFQKVVNGVVLQKESFRQSL
jgi:hypothetical protein